jgi:hypothetical protein
VEAVYQDATERFLDTATGYFVADDRRLLGSGLP